ncbi:MAG: hypothetical protein ACK53V_07535, partial [Planctomycetota bacterium]
FAEPLFVVAIHPAERAVVIGPRDALMGRAVEARSLNWLADAPAAGDAVPGCFVWDAEPGVGGKNRLTGKRSLDALFALLNRGLARRTG